MPDPWLLRIEDIDQARSRPQADRSIIDTLARLGMHSDRPIVWQSHRIQLYEHAFERLEAAGRVYACACSRREIADSRILFAGAPIEGEPVYPGTCRNGLAPGRPGRAWRLRIDPEARIQWTDRAGTETQENLPESVGDFVLRRADGPWAYQLAAVVDDAEQGVTDVVRGEDLAGSTARQIFLQRCLGLERPRYLHLPVVVAADGRKLSKQNGAGSIDDQPPIDALNAAIVHLGLKRIETDALDQFWPIAVDQWQKSRWMAR
jgi:glutamyl-Q tRNA(Asp) synthetase